MHWDPKRRRYVENGHVIPPAQVRAHVNDYIESEQSEVNKQAERLLAGAITLAAFFQFMRHKVTAWHAIAGTIAYGGQSQMTPERWAKINEKIVSELAYLDGFQAAAEQSFSAVEAIASSVAQVVASEVPAGLEAVVERGVLDAVLNAAPSEAAQVAMVAVENALSDSIGVEEAAAIADLVGESVVVTGIDSLAESLIGGTIASRAELYADSLYATFVNNVTAREFDNGVTMGRRICLDDPASCDECPDAATEEFIPLDDVPEIGSLACFSNCRCSIEYGRS